MRHVPLRHGLCAAAVASAALLVPSVHAATVVSPGPVPRATCGPGSLPETGAQGRVPASDVASGRAALGYTCNTQLIGHYASGGQFKTLRYVDAAGHECAYFDTPQQNVIAGTGRSAGVHVIDMHDPAHPALSTTLTTPAMLSPHESLLLNQKRGLLVADMGTAATAPGFVDVYDVSKDCLHPTLDASAPVGVLGHESAFAPDGRTFYVTSPAAQTIAAVDLTNPQQPQLLTVYFGVPAHGGRVSDDGNRLYIADDSKIPAGDTVNNPAPDQAALRIFDVSQVQRRVLAPQIVQVSKLDWANKSVPQVPTPVTIKGHHYIIDVDEFSTNIGQYDPAARVGAARIINIDDEKHPAVVSNLRLEVNQPAARAGDQQNDPGANSDISGYAAHYCNVPREVDPGIVACSFIRSGLRVFDIRDPRHPRELAYFNPPGQNGGNTLSAPVFVPARHEIWYTDGTSGLWVLRLTNGVWRGTGD